MPLPHGTVGSSRYLAPDDVTAAMDGDAITIRTTEEMEKYGSLRRQEFARTRVYDVNLLEGVGSDEELPTILRTIGWGKLYDEPPPGGCHSLSFPWWNCVLLLLLSLNDRLALTDELVWRQHSRPQLHRRLTLQEPQWDTGYGGGYLGHHESGTYYCDIPALGRDG
jgi:hypothetical protein